MARITVEDCLTKETNRFALVLLSAERTKQLLSGAKALVDAKGNKSVVTSLREIADGTVRFMTEEELRLERERERKEREEQRLREEAEAAASREAALAIAKSHEDASGESDDNGGEADADESEAEVSISGADNINDTGTEPTSVGPTSVGDAESVSEGSIDPETTPEGEAAVDIF